jgi:two-component system sensor histidine kinase RegB
VLLISWLLWRSGGVLNPASVSLLVQTVVGALVLGRAWTWAITALSAGAYAALFLVPPAELRAAQVMHPEIAVHMRGMWIAFAGAALIIGMLVARLAAAIERRDAALQSLRERSARATRVAGLATLAAGAAHELSTPLSTIAVAARELERSLVDGQGRSDWRQDAGLIRTEAGRCRQILDDMAAGRAGTSGETPRPARLSDVVAAAGAHVSAEDWKRVDVDLADDARVVWPARVVARALTALLHNALQATSDRERVRLRASVADGAVRVSVIDQGAGMSADTLARAGEPFFTTKPAGAGTGLGLFVARSSVEQLGGSLVLDSAVGRGTSASVILPTDVISRGPEADA